MNGIQREPENRGFPQRRRHFTSSHGIGETSPLEITSSSNNNLESFNNNDNSPNLLQYSTFNHRHYYSATPVVATKSSSSSWHPRDGSSSSNWVIAASSVLEWILSIVGISRRRRPGRVTAPRGPVAEPPPFNHKYWILVPIITLVLFGIRQYAEQQQQQPPPPRNWNNQNSRFATIARHNKHHHDGESDLMSASWKIWDHNQYKSSLSVMDLQQQHSQQHHGAAAARILMLQVSTPLAISEIASRPNRAYARQWSMDFVLAAPTTTNNNNINDSTLTGSTATQSLRDATNIEISSIQQECWAATTLLNFWKVQHDAKNHHKHDRQEPLPSYILLLSSDAIIVDMDSNLELDLLTTIKTESSSNVLAMRAMTCNMSLWNILHPDFAQVVRAWKHQACHPKDEGDNKNNNNNSNDDAFSTLSRIAQSMQQSWLNELNSQAVVRFKFPTSNSSNNNGKTSATTTHLVQQVADSVCYRYYPRCEVVV